jgi:hypothetical protein
MSDPLAVSGTYKFSGDLGLLWPLVPLAALVGAVALGFAYGYINVWNPLIYFEVLATIGFGCLLGVVPAKVAVFVKCRNPSLVCVSGLLAGLVGLYVGWATFMLALIDKGSTSSGLTWPTVVSSPGAVWQFAWALGDVGWFGIGRHTGAFCGLPLYICWLLEAGIVVGGACLVSMALFSDKVYCETCGRWCEEKKDALRLAITFHKSILDKLRSGDLTALDGAARPGSPMAPFVRINQTMCAACGNTGTYQLDYITPEQDEKGKMGEKVEGLTRNMVLTADSARQLGKLTAQAQQRPAPAPAPSEKPPATT